MVCGIDEAGRGPLAGPLVMAGVILTQPITNLNDSKKLTPKQRQRLFEEITIKSLYKVVIIKSDKIDQIGLSKAIKEGLEEIKSSLKATEYIFDGNSNFGVDSIKTVIKADTKLQEVMAASIVAKVTRDKIMCQYATMYPEYNFCKNKGYGTKEHIEAIKRYGVCPIHRKSFRPKALQATLF